MEFNVTRQIGLSEQSAISKCSCALYFWWGI